MRMKVKKKSTFLEGFLGEGQNSKELHCRMADVAYLKINERSNVERPILRE